MLMVTIRERGGLLGYGGGDLPAPFPALPTSHFFCSGSPAFAPSGTPKSKEKRKKKGSPSPFPPCSSPAPPSADLVGLNVLGAKHALHLSKAGWVRTDGTVGNCLTTEALLASSSGCQSLGKPRTPGGGEEFGWMIVLEQEVSLGLPTARARRCL